jgi:hypothetical protein
MDQTLTMNTIKTPFFLIHEKIKTTKIGLKMYQYVQMFFGCIHIIKKK